MALGHPRRYVLERVEDAIRLRDIKSPDSDLIFNQGELEAGAKVELQGAAIQLRYSTAVAPAYEPGDSQSFPGRFGKMRVYHRSRGWALECADLKSFYAGVAEGLPVFCITEAQGDYHLECLAAHPIRFRTTKGIHELKPEQSVALGAEQLSEISIREGVYDWSFNRPEEIAVPQSRVRDLDSKTWRRNLAAAGALVTSFLFLCMLWPRPELVVESEPMSLPEITLAKPIHLKVATAPNGGASKKVATAAASTPSFAPSAFEGNKLQSAMKGLFQGGMTRLLARSEFGPGNDRSDIARKLFDSGSPALHSTAPITGPGIGRGTQIAALGGAGGGQGGKSGVGYGQGEHANVQGQGRSLVAMDTSGSSVDEGLTKDEVGKVIHRHLSEVRYCYEASILREPDLEGKLVLGFTINGSGKVKIAEVRTSTVTDSKLDDCIVRRLVAWRFPQTKGGIDVGVTYPFIFKTLGG